MVESNTDATNSFKGAHNVDPLTIFLSNGKDCSIKQDELITITEEFDDSDLSSVHKRRLKKGKLLTSSLEALKRLRINT
jgi:hypothetical protein